MSSNELQALFSNLRPRSQESNSASPVSSPFVPQTSRPSSSLAFSHTVPVSSTPPPPFTATIDETSTTTGGNMTQARSTSGATAQNLLSLLNFAGSHGSTSALGQSAPATSTSPPQSSSVPISASDLVARFMSPVPSPKPEQKQESIDTTQADGSATRNQLLELLNKQASATLVSGAQEEQEQQEDEIVPADIPVQSIETTAEPSTTVPEDSPALVADLPASREHTPFETHKSASPMPSDNKPIFTYTNPFEALNASRNQTPVATGPALLQTSPPSTFNFQQSAALSSPDAISARKKLTPKLRSKRSATSALREQSPNALQTQDDEATRDVTPLPVETTQSTAETPPAILLDEFRKEAVDIDRGKEQDESIVDDQPDNQDGSGEWEDADDSPDKDVVPRQVPVYNFPIKAFVSITLHLGAGSDISIRDDGVMEISRLKKEFDQLDRSLAAATTRFITYAFVKNGGMRIIRQQDGCDRQVFKNSHDRIFNVAFCTTATNAGPSPNQAVLGTGVSGAVYYANVSKEGSDPFEKNQLDSESLVFPPYPQADENTAGGVLKTRAKRSSRHPEYFAIGRGKSIHLIWPATALSPRYGISDTNRTVDVEKFYADRPLQISTGKAGKDFTFSEDDTLIVSLDKTGRLRFWDIRNLVDESNATAARISPVVVDTPVLSLSTASPAEKSWPTSVTFVDKARPYKKGGALRYVLVGLRQNHTLQLWDIALGKAVQELNFPHENETDGICSVNYHPETGVIVLSHPTRNSIFFIHLSAPRYSLSSQLSQAAYVERIAAKDPDLPKPESTACMSGIREISFAEKGQLRSVELLAFKQSENSKDDSLFELYVVHSRGVTCLGINREDLGWNPDNKVMYPIDAQQEGLVSLKELRLGSVIEEPIRSKSPVKEVVPLSKNAKKKVKKTGQTTEEVTNGVEEIHQALHVSPQATSKPVEVSHPEPDVQDTAPSKESKKAKKKVDKTVQAPEPAVLKELVEPVVQTDDKADSPTVEVTGSSKTGMPNTDIPVEWLEKKIEKIEQTIAQGLKKELDALYQNIQTDRTAQDMSSASRQEAVLRLVSSSLSTNVEKSLSRILAQQMQQLVVPAVVQHASAQISDTLTSTLHQTFPHEIGTHLPTAVNAALQNPHMSRTISESVSQKLSKHLETQLFDMVVKSVTPVFKSIATAAAEQASSDMEARLSAQIRQLQIDRAADNEKLDKLSNVLQGMAGTLQAMTDSQVAFQGQILRDRQTLANANNANMINTSRQVSTARGTPDPAPLPKPKTMRIRSKADIELEEITNMMNEGRYEEGSIRWLQSPQPVKLFDELFVRFTPEYLATDVSPLVAFSVAVTVANSLNTNIERRLEWISAAFDAVDLQDPEIADLSQHAPALITSLVQKLESLYMTVAERNPADPMLRAIPALAKKGRDMKSAFAARAAGSVGSTLHHLTGSTY